MDIDPRSRATIAFCRAPRRAPLRLVPARGAAASSPKAGAVAFDTGVPRWTTPASVLRVRVGRLLDPRRDRGARLASTTSLVTGLLWRSPSSCRRSWPRLTFLDAVAVTAPARPCRQSKSPRAGPPHEGEHQRGGAEPPQRHMSRGNASDHSGPPEAAVHPFAGAHERGTFPPRCHSTAASFRRSQRSRACMTVVLVPLAGIATAPTPVAPRARSQRLHDVCCQRVAGAAVATAAHARNAGVSIGRFSPRAGKAVAKTFSLVKPCAFRRTSRGGLVMRVFLVKPSHVSFGTAVIMPRWLYVFARATPSRWGDPIVADETLDPFDAAQLAPAMSSASGSIPRITAWLRDRTARACAPRLRRLRRYSLHALSGRGPRRGGAHAVVHGDGDVISATVIDDCAAECRVRFTKRKNRWRTFKSARWNLLPKTGNVGIDRDGARVPEALFVLLGLAHRWPGPEASGRPCRDPRGGGVTTTRVPVHRAR